MKYMGMRFIYRVVKQIIIAFVCRYTPAVYKIYRSGNKVNDL